VVGLSGEVISAEARDLAEQYAPLFPGSRVINLIAALGSIWMQRTNHFSTLDRGDNLFSRQSVWFCQASNYQPK